MWVISEVSEDDRSKLFDSGEVPCPFCLNVFVNYSDDNYCCSCAHPLHRGLKRPSGRKSKPYYDGYVRHITDLTN